VVASFEHWHHHVALDQQVCTVLQRVQILTLIAHVLSQLLLLLSMRILIWVGWATHQERLLVEGVRPVAAPSLRIKSLVRFVHRLHVGKVGRLCQLQAVTPHVAIVLHTGGETRIGIDLRVQGRPSNAARRRQGLI